MQKPRPKPVPLVRDKPGSWEEIKDVIIDTGDEYFLSQIDVLNTTNGE